MGGSASRGSAVSEGGGRQGGRRRPRPGGRPGTGAPRAGGVRRHRGRGHRPVAVHGGGADGGEAEGNTRAPRELGREGTSAGACTARKTDKPAQQQVNTTRAKGQAEAVLLGRIARGRGLWSRRGDTAGGRRRGGRTWRERLCREAPGRSLRGWAGLPRTGPVDATAPQGGRTRRAPGAPSHARPLPASLPARPRPRWLPAAPSRSAAPARPPRPRWAPR